MKQPFIILLMLILTGMGLQAQDRGPVNADTLRSWCEYLAGDGMKGRRNGSPEMKEAAGFIADLFSQAGLMPWNPDSGFFQHYRIQSRNGTVILERNVIGILEGADPALKDEWIVLSAHFDHIGTGKPVNGDSIYNGANDNATGTLTVAGLARLLGTMKEKPGRSLMFVAFSGEEMGLRGSRWFMEHPPVPADRIKLNLNFEMEGEAGVGPNRYILTGHRYTDLDEQIDNYNRGTSWSIARNYKSREWIFLASDNASFAIKTADGKRSLNIPAFTLVTTDETGRIHQVTDDPSFIDYEHMAGFLGYAGGLVLHLSSSPLNPSWDQAAFDREYGK